MSRNAALLILALLTFGFLVYATETVRAWSASRPQDTECGAFLQAPRDGWFKVANCTLDVEDMVLEGSEGEFESLQNRRKGLSSKLYDHPPKWVAAWIPMQAPMGRSAKRTAALRSESADLLKWVAALEAADDLKREKMWEDPVTLRRMSVPAFIEGRSEKPAGNSAARVFGTTASVNLHVIRPGLPPEQVHPIISIGLAGLGLCLATVLLLFFSRAPRLEAGAVTPELVSAREIVEKEKLEIGALEEMRNEERARQQRKKGGR